MEENIDISLKTKEEFIKAFELINYLGYSNKMNVSAYQLLDNNRIILYDTYNKNMNENVVKLLYEMNMKQIAEFIWGWLESLDIEEPSYSDGSNIKGFNIIANRGLFNVNDLPSDQNFFNAFCIISPIWFYYGK